MFNFNLTLCKDIVIFLFNQIFLYFLYFSNKLLQTTGQEYKKEQPSFWLLLGLIIYRINLSLQEVELDVGFQDVVDFLGPSLNLCGSLSLNIVG